MNATAAPLLAGEAILCYAPDPWAGLWRNRHQIMSRLARQNTVVYIEPRLYLGDAKRRFREGRLALADLRRPLLTRPTLPLGAGGVEADEGPMSHDFSRAASRSATQVAGSISGSERSGLWLYHDPYWAPYAGRLRGGLLTASIRRVAMRRMLAQLAIRRPILWLLRPFHADQIGLYDEKLVVYQITDEYSDFPLIRDKAAFLREEEALLRRADLVIVTSPGLLASKGRFNPRTHLVPNAVDYAGFRAALADPRSGARLAAYGLTDAMPHPRIGYVGALNEKIDFDLLAGIAAAQPDWQLILVGSLDLTVHADKADAVHRQPNVCWPGRLPVEDVPAAIAAMDVCLLPYEQNPWTANIDSLKLYEYLACGKPIVSTDVPASRAFGGLVRIAEGAAGFVAAIEAALREDAADQVAARRAAAAANTWDMRVAQISSLLVEAVQAR